MKMKVKLPLSTIVLGLVILGIFIATQVITSQQKSDGLVINLAGRQRMLSQRMTKELFICFEKAGASKDFSNTKTSLLNTMKIFDITLTALRDGKEAPTSLNLKTSDYRKCPIPARNVQEQLSIVTDIWKEYSKILTGVINSGFKDKSQLSVIEKMNITLLSQSNKAVSMMQKSSEKRVKFLIWVQLLGLILGAVAIGWSVFVVTNVLKKLSSVNSIVKQYASGNLTERVDVGEINDELDETQSEVNDLGEKTGGIVRQIYNANDVLVNVSKDFSQTFEVIANSAESVKSGSNTVAAAAEQASASVNSISSGTKQMSTSVQSVATSMEEMSASINEVAKSCQKESSIAEEASQKVKSTHVVMGQLSSSAQEIGRIVSAINDIADKTNLLALNATIEAASAGDAGKGFAVVANEVKELAKQTALATDEIKQQIGTMQENTASSLDAMDEISSVIEDVNSISHTIVVAVEEQSATANEIARSIGEASNAASTIARNVEETAMGISEVSSNIQKINVETGDMADNIISSHQKVNELAGLGEELKSVVSVFKI